MRTKFTLKDKVMQHSLKALSSYEEVGNDRLIVDGGIANQLYVQPHLPDLLRPTHDLDLLPECRFTYRLFKEKIGEYFKTILQMYDPEVSVLRHNYEVKLTDQNGNPFFIHAYKWTQKRFEQERRNLERKAANANEITIPNSAKPIYVVRPEDIVQGKTRRLKKLDEKGKITEDCQEGYRSLRERDWETLAGQDFTELLEIVVRKKRLLPAFLDGSREEFNKALDDFVCSKDIYDIALISLLASIGVVDFDERYYDQILNGSE